MNNKKSLAIRLSVILSVICLFVFSAAYFLADLQIVNGEYYKENSSKSLSNTTPVYASRGEIVDRNGVKLVSNSTAFIIRLEKSTWDIENQNQVILNLISILEKYNAEYHNSLPITLTNDSYSFSSNTDDFMKFLKKRADSDTLTADESMNFLKERYKIDASYNKSDALKIAVVRYEMDQRNFSTFNSFIFAEKVPIEVVTIIKERNLEFTGVYIDTKPVREYKTPYAAHILGRVGLMSPAEYEKLKEQGYKMDATVGKDGMEKVLEPYLKSTNGKNASALIVNGETVSKGVTIPPIPGNNAVLTIDIALQRVAEESMAKTFPEIRAKGEDIEGGAAVVIDVKTGEILVLASYPTYNLATFGADFNDLQKDPLLPMVNRAISGLYAPGSTYKMVPAIAALEEGIVTPSTIIRDQGIYKFYAPEYSPKCWIYRDRGGTHGNVNVSTAIKHSCNYYFYEVGRLLTASVMEEYAQMFGLGNYTGIELLGEKKGVIAGPTHRDLIGSTWYPGDTLSAAIGQSDHLFTPIGLANYIATVANGGTLNQAHLLKSIESHDYSETILENNPKPLKQSEFKEENILAVQNGMNNVVNEGGTAAYVFRNYPIQVAGKTGSSEVTGGDANGLFASYAPFDDPQIAVLIIGEHAGSGGNVAVVARDIYDAYFGFNEEVPVSENIIIDTQTTTIPTVGQ